MPWYRISQWTSTLKLPWQAVGAVTIPHVELTMQMFLLLGISQWDASGKPSRYLSSTHLSARVGGLNPRWNQVCLLRCCFS